MIIKPRVRGFICVTAHPVGCEANVKEQIDYVTKNGVIEGGAKENVICDRVRLLGTVRSFDPMVREQLEAELHHVAAG